MGTKPFMYICLDFLGLTLVNSMTNKQATMKVWPLLMVCQSTGAVHMEVSHNYGTEVFLLQFDHYVAIRGCPKKVVSDVGSQLTSADNYIAWSEKEAHSNWGWDMVKEAGARTGTEWEFVPPGCQFRNGLAES